MIEFKHSYIHPHLMVFDGIKYIMPGSIEVPMETDYKDIKWVKPEVSSLPNEENTWKFKSSSGDGEYTVWKNGNYLNCNCMGYFRSRGNCKHVKEVKKELGIKYS